MIKKSVKWKIFITIKRIFKIILIIFLILLIIDNIRYRRHNDIERKMIKSLTGEHCDLGIKLTGNNITRDTLIHLTNILNNHSYTFTEFVERRMQYFTRNISFDRTNNIHDEDFQEILNIPPYAFFEVYSVPITDASVPVIIKKIEQNSNQHNIVQFSIGGTDITDKGMETISNYFLDNPNVAIIEYKNGLIRTNADRRALRTRKDERTGLSKDRE